MSKTVISFGLSEQGIDRAIKELAQYKKDFQRKCDLLRERVAERIAWSASRGFSVALGDDLIGEEAPRPNVHVTVQHGGNISVVFAEGKDAAFIEFGTGVYSNTSAGSSPHPKGQELGLTIGSYGVGYGKQRVWGYRDEAGEIHLSRGVPAAMPMYHAVQDAVNVIADLVREIFG